MSKVNPLVDACYHYGKKRHDQSIFAFGVISEIANQLLVSIGCPVLIGVKVRDKELEVDLAKFSYHHISRDSENLWTVEIRANPQAGGVRFSLINRIRIGFSHDLVTIFSGPEVLHESIPESDKEAIKTAIVETVEFIIQDWVETLHISGDWRGRVLDLPREGDSDQKTRFLRKRAASNTEKLAKLIGGRKVECIFDPYLDTRGLMRLVSLSDLGVKFSGGLRLLGDRGNAKKITSLFFGEFCEQVAQNAMYKLSASSEHRRFFVLSGGTVLILGPSLNTLTHNESAHVEKDSRFDREFFEAEWNKAVSFLPFIT